MVLAALILLVAGCGGGTTATTAPAGDSTTTVTVNVGDTVTWVNQDAPQHDIVADNGEFKSDLLDKGATFSFTFTKAGTYPYHCTIHPGMTGTIIVQ